MISALNKLPCGITINNVNYKVFCYADDVILCSTTASGLQCLINTAVELIVALGLRFNPSKTSCMIIGKNPFKTLPIWTIPTVDCCGAVASVRDSYTDDPSSIPVRLVVASW